MTTMLEKAARAASEADVAWEDERCLDDWGVKVARAVLSEIRNAPEVAEIVYRAESYAHSDWSKIWSEQIDYILNEDDQP